MVDVSTTITIKFDYMPDQLRSRVVAEVPDAPAELLALLRKQLGARTSDDGQRFDVEVQYALTASNHVKAAGSDAQFRPVSVAVPLPHVIDEAIRVSTERANWPVTAVEVLSESVDFTFANDFESLVLHATCTARITQARPDKNTAMPSTS